MTGTGKKSGFVCLVGLPNVGKSTLLNRLVGTDLAIVSPRPQTTWNTVRGILSDERGQIVFIDTPGLHRPADGLGRRMVSSARRALGEADLVYWLEDCRSDPESALAKVARLLPRGLPAFLVLNKADLVPKPSLLPRLEVYGRAGRFREIVPLSALTGENCDRLLPLTFECLPPGEELFPGDMLSDQPEKDLMREFIREKVFLNTRQEIPYASAVKIEYVREEPRRLVVGATIFVERESQKGIVVGKGASMLKKIGTQARGRIEALVGMPIFLDLRVKVRPKWRGDARSLTEFGYRD
ncbi:MAG TPA: GTPase Era [bacterium]|nr:GTPase Era [bacterium]HPQ65987.1 GTPase Era [bacterium]